MTAPVVVKVGGGQDLDLDAIAKDVAALVAGGQPVVLVHGGAATLDDVATQLGHPPEFVVSPSGYTSRRTDRRTLEIFEMVYCGQLNKAWVERLQRLGVQAVGLSGLDGRIWEGKRKAAIRIVEDGRQKVLRDDFTGKVERVNRPLLEALLQQGYLPVLCPPAISYEGEAINVDGDRAAAQTAIALQAVTFVILSSVPGLLSAFPDESSLIEHIPAVQVDSFVAVAEDRMKKKVLGASEALAGGVRSVVFADGRVDRPVARALDGKGTVLGD